MIICKTGDIFTSNADMIAHGVNCLGFMGAGIAAAVQNKSRKTYLEYRAACDAGELAPGMCLAIDATEDFGRYMTIANIASQLDPGPDAKLDWLTEGVLRMYLDHTENSMVVAIPQIGCGIGGLSWDVVGPVLAGIAKAFPQVTTEFWTYA